MSPARYAWPPVAWKRPDHRAGSRGRETLMCTSSPAPGWVSVTVMSHQAGTPEMGAGAGYPGTRGAKVTVPPALAAAVTDTTLAPEGAGTGTAAQGAEAIAAAGPLCLLTAPAAAGTRAAAAGTAAAIKTI